MIRNCILLKINSLIAALLLSLTMTAQKQFIHFDTNDGLVDMSSEVIYHDSYGYVWIGTYGGISRFDGYDFRNYTTLDTVNPLASNTIFSIVEDHYRNIWVGTSKELELYNRKLDRFESLPNVYKSCIKDIVECKATNTLWLATYSGLISVDIDLQSTKHRYTLNDGLPSMTLTAVVCDAKNNLWIGTQDKGLIYFDTKKETFKIYESSGAIDNKDLESNKITALALDNQQNLWIATSDIGIAKLDAHTLQFTHFSNNDDDKLGLEKDLVSDILIDSNNEVWICKNGRLYIFDDEKNDFERYNPMYGNESFSKQKSIYTISEDRFKNKWIGTHAGGIFCQKNRQNKFTTYSGYLNLENSSNTKIENVRSFVAYRDKLMLGTDGSGILVFDPKKNIIEPFESNNQLTSPTIMHTTLFGDELWCSTWGGGLCRANLRNGKIIPMPLKDEFNQIINCDDIRYTTIIDSIAWIGTSGEGLVLYDIANDKFLPRQICDTFNLKTIGWVSCILCDRNGTIWISTFDGLYRYDKSSGFKLIHHEDGNDHTISNDVVYSIFEDSYGDLWFSTNNGLDKYSPETETFENIKLEKSNNYYRSIVEDDEKNLWISTDAAIYKFNNDLDVLEVWDRNRFLLEGDFNINAGLKSRNGNIYFGGKNGFITFAPKDLQYDTISPNITLSNFYINNQKQAIGSKYLRQSISFTDTIEMDYTKAILSFEVIDRNHLQSPDAEFYYFMDGLSDKRISVDASRKISYSNIPAGKYDLWIIAYYDNGKTDNCLLTLIINPPWWGTVWFKTILIIGCVVLIYLVILLRLQIVRRQNKTLQQIVEEKTQELKISNKKLETQNQKLKEDELLLQIKNDELANSITTKDKLFSIIAHDLKNPLSVIMGFSNHLNDNFTFEDRINKQIKAIYNASVQINNQIETLLNWSRSQTGSIQCKPQNIHIESLIKDNITLLSEIISNKQIEIIYKFNHTHDATADLEMINIVYRNILGNAIKFTSRGGRIEISTYNTHDFSIIETIDNGIGMSDEMVENLFNVSVNQSTVGTENEKGTGLGLIICRDFLNINKAKIEVKSELGKGSSFKIFLPKGEPTSKFILNIENNNLQKSGIETMPEIDEVESKPLILIVDDNAEIRNYIANLFSPYYIIEVANDGIEGYEKSVSLIPSLIITDIAMPRKDGLEMCRDIKANAMLNHIPILILSAQNDIKTQLLSIGNGAFDFISKPFSKQMLVLKVRALLQNREQYKKFLHHKILDNNQTSENNINYNEADNKFIKQIQEVIAKSYNNSTFGVEQFASEMGYSRSQLFRKMKATFDISPVEYLKIYRLTEAKKMLESGNRKISETAYDVGFNDPMYFSNCFKNHFGHPPNFYLKNNNSTKN